MNELSELPQTLNSKPNRPRKSFIGKRWKQITAATHPNKYHLTVRAKINSFLRILETVKTEYLQPGQIYFERDQMHDPSDPFTIHTFLTDTFYWYVECDLLFNINIHYEFNHCPFEHKVIRLMHSNHLMPIAKRKPRNLYEYLKDVIACQDPQLIHKHQKSRNDHVRNGRT